MQRDQQGRGNVGPTGLHDLPKAPISDAAQRATHNFQLDTQEEKNTLQQKPRYLMQPNTTITRSLTENVATQQITKSLQQDTTHIKFKHMQISQSCCSADRGLMPPWLLLSYMLLLSMSTSILSILLLLHYTLSCPPLSCCTIHTRYVIPLYPLSTFP